jgi:hypothetical protein
MPHHALPSDASDMVFFGVTTLLMTLFAAGWLGLLIGLGVCCLMLLIAGVMKWRGGLKGW